MSAQGKRYRRTYSRKITDYNAESFNGIVKEGIVTSASSSFVGSFLSPLVLSFGASNTYIAMLSSLPPLIGSLLQYLSLFFTNVFGSLKNALVFFMVLSGFCLFAISFILYANFSNLLFILFLIVVAYTVFITLINPIWISFIAHLIPKHSMKMLGRRNGMMSIASLGSLLFGGFLIQNNANSFPLLFFLAGTLWIAGGYYIKRIKGEKCFFVPMAWRLPRANSFKTFYAFIFLFYLFVSIASPFLVVYKFNVINLSYIQYTALICIVALTRYFASPYWGKQVDRFGSLKVLLIGSLLVSFVPIAYALIPKFELLIFVSLFSGFAWSAFDISLLGYLITHIRERTRLVHTTNINTFTGIARFLGAGLGAFLIPVLDTTMLNGIIILMIVSGILRLILTVTLGLKVTERRRRIRLVEEGKSIYMLAWAIPAKSVTHQLFHHMMYDIRLLRRLIHRNRRNRKIKNQFAD